VDVVSVAGTAMKVTVVKVIADVVKNHAANYLR